MIGDDHTDSPPPAVIQKGSSPMCAARRLRCYAPRSNAFAHLPLVGLASCCRISLTQPPPKLSITFDPTRSKGGLRTTVTDPPPCSAFQRLVCRPAAESPLCQPHVNFLKRVDRGGSWRATPALQTNTIPMPRNRFLLLTRLTQLPPPRRTQRADWR